MTVADTTITQLPPEPHVDVVIVGAGIAGLSAAEILARRNLSVLLLDSRSYIGGRVCSVPTQPWPASAQGSSAGSPDGPCFMVDVGAGWLHGGVDNGESPLLPYLSASASLYPIPGNSQGPFGKNPWTDGDGSVIQVIGPSAACHCPDGRAACLARAHAVWAAIQSEVGHRVRCMGEEELRGKTYRNVQGSAHHRLAGLATCTQHATSALQCLYGAWTGSELMNVPASECEGMGLQGEGGTEGDYAGAHYAVGCSTCESVSADIPCLLPADRACMGQIVSSLAARCGLGEGRTSMPGQGKGCTLLLNTAVKRVQWHEDAVSDVPSCVVHADGPDGPLVLGARAVLLTPPVPVLARGGIDLQPPLPGWKQDALRAVRVCGYKKVILSWEHAWWPSGGPMFWYCPVPQQGDAGGDAHTQAQEPSFELIEDWCAVKGVPVLKGILVGESAFGPAGRAGPPWSSEACVRGLLATLQATWPDVPVPTPLGQAVSTWEQDPLAGYGAYAAASASAGEGDWAALSCPVGPLFFAGDGIHSEHTGSVHGAMLAGRDAAQDIACRIQPAKG